MTESIIAATLLWALAIGIYVLMGFITVVAPSIVTRIDTFQEQSRRWLKRLPVIVVATWLVLVAVNLLVEVDVCRLCEPGQRFPW